MGSITYNFLADSILLHASSIANNFENESVERLENELSDYREFCITNYDELINEIVNKKSSLKVFSSSEFTPINLLSQTALYIDQFILPDPIFKLTEQKSELSNTTSKYFGYNESVLKKEDILKACKFLQNVTPMIAGDYVKIFPLSFYFERPTIPFYHPKDYFNDVLPSEILKFFRENAEVSSLEKMKSGGWQVMKGKLYPCRGIAVDFKNSNLYSGMIFHLVETKVLEVDETTGKVKFAQFLPPTPPTDEEFNAWVHQSINSASRKFFNEIFLENAISASLNSTYLCNNLFTSEFITKHFETQDSIQTYTATQVVNLELPFLDKIDIVKLMSIRQNEGDVFMNFRIELEKQFRELRTITDEKQLKLKSENIMHELNDVQGQKIKTKIEYLKSQLALNSLLGIGGLAATFQTAGTSLVATALALGKGYKDYKDYKEKVVENPAYLLWRIKK